MMNLTQITYTPVEGKTYSLFGDSRSTDGYYTLIRNLADGILETNRLADLLELIANRSSRKRWLRKAGKEKQGSRIGEILRVLSEPLGIYTLRTREHLESLSWKRFRDRRLGTTEEQYHLYMLEIELTNRLYREDFLQADRKVALQPHCLQDFGSSCRAEQVGADYRCRFCSKNCFQHHASRILRENHVDPWIWMGSGIDRRAREAARDNQTFGILGIACIPELVWGMRKCRKYRIPVVGVPLDANRCARWFGEFRPNSVNLQVLQNLVSGVG